MAVVEFEDEDGASSSDMDEYESEDELGDMFCSPRSQKHKKPQPTKTAGAEKPKAKPRKTASSAASSEPKPPRPPVAPTSGSKPQPNKPPVAKKPVKSSISVMKPSVTAGATDSVKPGATSRSDDVGSFLGMKEYMDAMDRELAKTTVGQSFVREGDEV